MRKLKNKSKKIHIKFSLNLNFTPFWCPQQQSFTPFWCLRQPNFTPFGCPRQPNFTPFGCLTTALEGPDLAGSRGCQACTEGIPFGQKKCLLRCFGQF